MGSRIEIEIDEVVLHEVGEGSRASLQAALETALVERFASLGLPEAWLAPSSTADVTHAALVSRTALRSGAALPFADGIADAIRGSIPSDERASR